MLDVHGRDVHGGDAAERDAKVVGVRRAVEKIRLCESDRVWYIICRSILM